jgi:hypothetical protein
MRRYGGQQPAVYLTETLTKTIDAAQDWNAKAPDPRRPSGLVPFDRFAALAGLILWAGSHTESADQNQPTKTLIKNILEQAHKEVGNIATILSAVADRMLKDESWKKKTEKDAVVVSLQKAEPLVFQISLNRDALPALTRSVPAVKADAAKTLFKVNRTEIGWAVLDSGIDGDHPAFRTTLGNGSRVKRSFDFINFRKIVSLSNTKDGIRAKNLKILMEHQDRLLQVPDHPVTTSRDLRRMPATEVPSTGSWSRGSWKSSRARRPRPITARTSRESSVRKRGQPWKAPA